MDYTNTKYYDYNLPEELIAQTPYEKRDTSRLLIMDRLTGELKDEVFYNIINYIDENDVLVLNDTRVLPARLFGEKQETGAKVEILLLKQTKENTWDALAKPAKRFKENSTIEFCDGKLKAKVIGDKGEGIKTLEFSYEGDFYEIIQEYGIMPLPPYIKKELKEQELYQTIYSKNIGSVAAPTAGLHFTKELLNKLKEKNVQIEYVTLHVGLGTFRPVKTDNIKEHTMHSEYYHIKDDVMKRLNEAKAQGKNIIAVGTTSARTLESASVGNKLEIASNNTDIFIYPPYKFKFVDKLITNFHLPQSTLLMMVSAFSTRDNIINAYNEAIRLKYKFFSFGDAMFIK